MNLLNRLHSPTFSVNNNSQTCTISKQLQYAAIEFSLKELSGSLLLVEEFGWIEIYFSGETQDCCTVQDAAKEAIEPCVLSYLDINLLHFSMTVYLLAVYLSTKIGSYIL